MAPLVVVALGTLGAMLAGRWIAHEVRRRVDDMGAAQPDPGVAERDQPRKLERDPATGIYRPK